MPPMLLANARGMSRRRDDVPAAAAMLIITLTGIPVSSVALMLMAGFVSLTVYLAGQKGGSA